MKKIIVVICMLTLVACKTKEEKMIEAKEDGNELVSTKAKLIEGVGDALQKEGKSAVESVTKGAGEIIKGANSGITESLNVSSVISQPSFKVNFEDCKAEKKYDSETDKSKKVSVYLIAKNDFKGKLILKAFNADKKEIGRSSIDIDIKKEDAKYVDFSFDERTHLLKTDYFTIQ
jgi:hypothetical protein